MNPTIGNIPFVYYFIFLWALLWKGLALWRAARGEQKFWFIAILFFNTLGVLEIIFLLHFAKNKLTVNQIKEWFSMLKR
jgi:methionyl-tRNA synthetase